MVDKILVKIKAGDGGDGAIHFIRERYRPKGGPDGGDGGKGGDVFVQVDTNLLTLYDFRSKSSYEAQSGGAGGADQCTGQSGTDLTLLVPAGTTLTEGDKIVADLTEAGEKVMIARGGKGGIGNWQFRSARNQVPYEATPGGKGQERNLVLELKFIADVGIIGLPSSGKTSLLNVLTTSHGKVASYHFTTLVPNLGVMDSKIPIADIPGLIEGASEGKGLGHNFLRHIERTKVLIHVIDVTSADIAKDYEVIRKELGEWGKGLLTKPEIIVINKIDLINSQFSVLNFQSVLSSQFSNKTKKIIILISTVTGEGIEELKRAIHSAVKEVALSDSKIKPISKPVEYNLETVPNRSMVFRP